MIVSIPSVETVFASSSASAGQIFTEFWPYMVMALGLFFGTIFLLWLFRVIANLLEKIFLSPEERHRRHMKEFYEENPDK